jgi:uncharacterized protein (TIGR02001 family)
MYDTKKILSTVSAAGLALFALAGNVAAADLGSIKDAPAPAEGRKFAFSWNIGATSDYIFRGFSQSARDPAWQLGADISYGILYAGVWSSHINFGNDILDGNNVATAEVDLYAGIKPTWGPATFDLGVIYYAYPGAKEGVGHSLVNETDYVEIKAGVSGAFIPGLDKLTLGYTAFYSPDYTNETGAVLTNEFMGAFELPKFWVFTPTVSATLGYQIGFDDVYKTIGVANGDDNYMYWNAGLALAVDKLTLDFRYWDTNLSETGTISNTFCHNLTLQCSSTFVFSAKLTF